MMMNTENTHEHDQFAEEHLRGYGSLRRGFLVPLGSQAFMAEVDTHSITMQDDKGCL